MENYNRNYGFKHISEEYKWMTPGWIKELTKHEPDYEVREYVTEILEDLTTPEKSRLVSSTDKFDCLEEYWFNRIAAYEKKLEDDEVYKWLMTSMDFYARNLSLIARKTMLSLLRLIVMGCHSEECG